MKASASHIKFAQQILDFIKQRDNFLLSGHINADGDAIASVIAVKLLLDALDKHSVMIFHDQQLDSRFNYLKNFDNILSYSKKLDFSNSLPKGKIESAIILDVPSYKRLGDIAGLLPEKSNIVKIDHHPLEDVMGNIDWVDTEASSATAMIYDIIDISKINFDPEIAKAIFTGIVYDTGRFSFSNTTARDLYICSKMVEIGAKPSDITNRIFFENSFSALKTIGKGLYSLEKYLDDAVNVIYLSVDDMKNSDQGEIEELANYSVAIRGGEVGLFIREVKPNFHKISFRSKNNVDVNKVAKAFDGGGHTKAAGCRITGAKNDILPKILKEIEKQL